MQPKAFFLAARTGQRFCLFHPAFGTTTRGLVLYVHPFAEEMNKARRMAALQSRALAQAGYAVLQMDLLGCGDSSGEFGDASWQDWVADIVHACHWLRCHANPPSVEIEAAPLWLWGLRAGCLLSLSAAKQLSASCNFLFWQPPPSGRVLLQQLLRLKVAGDMLNGKSKEAIETLRKKISNGTPVEIAGYMLSAELAMGLEQAEFAPPPFNGPPPRLEWLEITSQENTGTNAIRTQKTLQWQQSGYGVNCHVVHGPAFWQSSESVDTPALIAATTAALAQPVV